MSTNSDQTELTQIKSPKEEIFDWLKSLGFTIDGDTATQITPGRVRQIIIDGQRSIQQGPDSTIKIMYVGEGSISNSEETISICGFDIERDGELVGPTEYFDSLQQFKTTMA